MFELVVIIICLILNALLAGSETAFIAVSRPTLRELTKQGHERAKLLLSLHDNPERILSVIQVGITFVGALAAAVGGAGAEGKIAPWLISHFKINPSFAEFLAMLIVVIPFTYISVVLGELVPKTIALRHPFLLASESAPWLHLISRLLNPIVTILAKSTKKIVDLVPQHQTFSEDYPKEFPIEFDTLPVPHKQYILNLFKIEKTTVKEILIEWPDVIYVESNQTIEQVENIIISCGHTRLPVVENSEVIGIINAKEFLAFQKTGQTNWLSLKRNAIKLPDYTPLITAMQILQEKRAHMAIVYNNTSRLGIITMEAIFEEIIGDIYDEEDDGTLKRILDSIHFKKR